MSLRQGFVAERNGTHAHIDFQFIILVVIMCGTGFVALYTGSMSYADRIFNDPLYFIRRQGLNFIAGLIALLVISFVNLDALRRQLPKIVLGTLVLSVLPFVPGIGLTKNGASRWIAIGSMTFQPSELIKMVMVVFLANLFAKKHDRLGEPEVSVYPAAFMSSLMVMIVYLQNDFSTSMFIICIALVMFFVAGVHIGWFLKLCLLSLPFVALMVLTEEYRMRRVLSFLNPHNDPLGAGYQVNAAIAALGEGGFWGRGLGNGIRKISSIPEVQSDFIFAVWGEEMGFFGVLVYFLLLVLFSIRGYRIALLCGDRFRCLLAFGCVSVILLQSMINCGIVVRAFPATGIPLPFFSSGGSSLLITLCLCGFVLNVSRWNDTGEMQYV